MATITQVNLTLQKSPVPTAIRTATVKFTTVFSAGQVQDHALFTADVKLQAIDDNIFGNPTLNMGVVSINANTTIQETTVTKIFSRSLLDEDTDVEIIFDHQGHPHRIIEEDQDEWRASVVLTPVTQNSAAFSPTVTGSWGAAGHD